MSPAILELNVTIKWVRIKDLYCCKRCKVQHVGYGYHLTAETNGIHNSNTTISDIILCTKCYNKIGC